MAERASGAASRAAGTSTASTATAARTRNRFLVLYAFPRAPRTPARRGPPRRLGRPQGRRRRRAQQGQAGAARGVLGARRELPRRPRLRPRRPPRLAGLVEREGTAGVRDALRELLGRSPGREAALHVKRSAEVAPTRPRARDRELFLLPLHALPAPDLAGAARRAASTTRPAPPTRSRRCASSGVVRGTIVAAWRLLRCNPFSHGGVDELADRRLFRDHEHAHATTEAARRACSCRSPTSCSRYRHRRGDHQLLPRRPRRSAGAWRSSALTFIDPAGDPAAVAEADPLDARAAGASAAAQGRSRRSTRTTSSASSRR